MEKLRNDIEKRKNLKALDLKNYKTEKDNELKDKIYKKDSLKKSIEKLNKQINNNLSEIDKFSKDKKSIQNEIDKRKQDSLTQSADSSNK